jgi:tRNA threonylcarbamoyladenosine biosynthesis protein TsaE
MDEHKIQNHKTSIVCNSPDELNRVAHQLIDRYSGFRIFAFYGEMGAGKTTLIKSLCQKLGVTDVVTSPTFSIINVYESVNFGPLYHFDFYRLKSQEEVFDIGYEDYLFSGQYCFLEWPEKVKNLLPRNLIEVTIAVDEQDNSRIIKF